MYCLGESFFTKVLDFFIIEALSLRQTLLNFQLINRDFYFCRTTLGYIIAYFLWTSSSESWLIFMTVLLIVVYLDFVSVTFCSHIDTQAINFPRNFHLLFIRWSARYLNLFPVVYKYFIFYMARFNFDSVAFITV